MVLDSYGHREHSERMKLYGVRADLLVSSPPESNMSRNMILEQRHTMSIEKRFLDSFILIISLFCAFQMMLILIIKFDLEPPNWRVFDYSMVLLSYIVPI
jgi:hypothetical protein